jgi:ribosomal protein S6
LSTKITGGKRKLAYNIKGLSAALYVFYTVEMPSQSVKKVESALNITDEVIRFLITKVDQKAIDKAEAFKAAKEASKAKKTKSIKDSKADKAEEDKESNEE